MSQYNIEFVNQVDSTNSYLKNKVRQQGVQAPYAVFASEQTAGRGQREKTWFSEPFANVLCSFLVSKPGSIAKISKLNSIAALAVVETLQSVGVANATIKWPNDVYVKDRKIAGILIETMLAEMEVKHAIVGVGLNVNQLEFEEELRATSIAIEIQNKFNVTDVLHKLYDSLYYFNTKDDASLLYAMNELLYKKNEVVTFEQDGRLSNYTVKAVLANGNLAVNAQGQELEIEHHQVKWVL